MANLAAQPASQAGTVVAYAAAAAGGDTFAPGEDAELRVKNASAGPITVTVASQSPCSQGVVHNLIVVVAAGAEVAIGPFPASRFASPATGLVAVTYSGVTTLTVAVVRV